MYFEKYAVRKEQKEFSNMYRVSNMGGLFTAQEWPEGSLPLIPEKGQFAILDTERERVLSVEPIERVTAWVQLEK